MESTQTRAPVVYRQERQLIAGRYRLASFHRGDNSTEVWRALDESTNQVVSLEFLRDTDPGNKEPFLAGARRLAAVAQPTVMKVAAIHDDADGVFIVFEHLVHIPVPIEWLKPVVPTPVAVATPVAAITTENTQPIAAAPEVAPAPATDAPTTEVAEERPDDRGLGLLLYALHAREFSLIDTVLLTDSAFELLGIIGRDLKTVRVDWTVLTDLLAYRPRFGLSLLTSPFAFLGGAAHRITTIRPRVGLPRPRASGPKPPKPAKVAVVKAVAPPKAPKPPKMPKMPKAARMAATPSVMAAPRAPRTSSGPRLHVRWGRVLTRGLSLGVLAAVLVTLPSELLGNVGTMASDLSVAIREKLATVVPTSSGLQRASFELPPLSAYNAAFESQAPYPTATANGTVEWVVALRNTGSVGWYRGIDGAQASLALTDGTTVAVQTTPYVGPGQVGWFVVHFPAPAKAGTSKVHLLPRIDGRGSLPDLGIYATVTVSPSP